MFRRRHGRGRRCGGRGCVVSVALVERTRRIRLDVAVGIGVGIVDVQLLVGVVDADAFAGLIVVRRALELAVVVHLLLIVAPILVAFPPLANHQFVLGAGQLPIGCAGNKLLPGLVLLGAHVACCWSGLVLVIEQNKLCAWCRSSNLGEISRRCFARKGNER